MQAGGHEFESRILHCASGMRHDMYLENRIREIDKMKYLNKTSEVIVITGNCVMVTHFEENKVKNWPKEPTHVTLYM